MKTDQSQMVHLKDYRKPEFNVSSLDLYFELFEDYALVHQTSQWQKNEKSNATNLQLHGQGLELVSAMVKDRESGSEKEISLKPQSFEQEGLLIEGLQFELFTLKITTKIYPQNNKTLSGLYKSGTMFCTQCEAQGFRRITYFLDRPDVLTKYKVHVEADKSKYPVLLSNGNLLSSQDLLGGRHKVTWEDPFPKPSYLFALVAGNLEVLEDHFTTGENRDVLLQIYVDPGRLSRVHHAMKFLKNSMKWDEERFGRYYDLDRFMIVAVDDFNMGAMENKGLNIFNSSVILADDKTATDSHFKVIEGIIGHEYFHNWSGNRVTCRDWFQLSLKEGLTVFRDQEYTADRYSRACGRLEDVRNLKMRQFSEDAGPQSHPVQPMSYMAIDNFYTATVYEKGAELVRMLHTLLGEKKFREGMDAYFAINDGKAVTIHDFVRAFEITHKIAFTQFKQWYFQSGTPQVDVELSYSKDSNLVVLDLKQWVPSTADDSVKKTLHIPIRMAFFDPNTGEILVEEFIELKDEKITKVFENICVRPLVSLNRGFTAPIKVNYNYSMKELLNLAKFETDPINQWDAFQRVFQDEILKHYNEEETQSENSKEGLKNFFAKKPTDLLYASLILRLPSISILSESLKTYDPVKLKKSKDWLEEQIALELELVFKKTYDEIESFSKFSVKNMGARSLKGICLYYLATLDKPEYQQLALKHYETARSMTHQMEALTALAQQESEFFDKALHQFVGQWGSDAVLINTWISFQAGRKKISDLSHLNVIFDHPHFSPITPNQIGSLLRSFVSAETAVFHSEKGYSFVKNQLLKADAFNPQLASRICGIFNKVPYYTSSYKKSALKVLKEVVKHKGLSKNSLEITTKIIEAVK